METKEIIRELRTKNGLSQDELAERVFVTRRRFRAGKTAKLSQTQKP